MTGPPPGTGDAERSTLNAERPPTWLSWARLVRLPNCCTAVADVLAGAAIAEAGSEAFSVGRLALAGTASALLYGGGCVLNDWADLPNDQLTKKERPLPSGAISPAAALAATGVLIAGGLGLATLAGLPVLLVGVVIAIAVLGYDLGLKQHALPGLAMLMTARFANVTLGVFAAAGGWPGGVAWLLGPSALALYVAGLTGMSLFEDRAPGRAVTLLTGALAPGVVIALVAFARDPLYAALPASWCVVSLTVALAAALRAPSPKTYGLYVRAAVLGVPLLDATLAIGVGAWRLTALILVLALGARALAKKIAT